jgi:S-formylglutathione hydrolase FrmB
VLVEALVAAAIALPGFHAVPQQPPDGGILLNGAIPFAQQQVNRGYVYLPPGYTAARRYPVVYLLHGMPGSPDEYVYSLHLASWADAQITAGSLQPFIAVVPSASQRTSAEWAGPWEQYLVHDVVPWVDAHLPTIPARRGRVIAGLSAGGFGAVDIGLRHPGVFGRIVSWSGYFHPLHDGIFKHADGATLAANDPWLLYQRELGTLRRDRTSFFLSTGPPHSHLEKPQETIDFAHALARVGLPVDAMRFRSRRGHWGFEFHAGMRWAFGT